MIFPTDLLPGDVLRYAGNSEFDNIIRVKTGAYDGACHVELYWGDGKTFTSRNGKGVAFYDFDATDLMDVLRPVGPVNIANGQKWAEALCGMPYGWDELACFLGEKPPNDSSLICSSTVAITLPKIGVNAFSSWFDLRYVSPRDFALSLELQRIWTRSILN